MGQLKNKKGGVVCNLNPCGVETANDTTKIRSFCLGLLRELRVFVVKYGLICLVLQRYNDPK
jgi:hypothetical protein